MEKYEVGDRVRVLPFAQINPAEAGTHLSEVSCYGINRDVVDEYASKKPYYTVVDVSGFSYVLDAEGRGGYLFWPYYALAPYCEDIKLPDVDPERLFTSLFGEDVEVWR